MKNKQLPSALLVGFVLLLLGALAGCSLLESAPEPAKPANPTGVSGKLNAEAEQLFAKAHVLWRHTETCSDTEKAVLYLDQALAIEPDYPQALQRRGLVLSQLGYTDEAFEDFTRAIRLDPTAEAYADRGLGLLRAGRYGGARKDLEQALRLDAHSHRAWNFLGAIATQEGKMEEACTAFENACSNGDCVGLESARREKLCK
ncbi:MAG: tetratricopeptide repeat protein [Bilophila sp.]